MNSKNARSAAHASAAGVHIAPGWPGIEYDDIQHIEATDPDDHVSRLARAHSERRTSERAQALELGWSEPEPKKAARVPRDSEPCPLWVFFVMAAFLVACFAVMGASALHAARMGAEAAMAYADALIPALVMWIGDVIRWVAQ